MYLLERDSGNMVKWVIADAAAYANRRSPDHKAVMRRAAIFFFH